MIIEPDYLEKHIAGFTHNAIFMRYQRLVINHTAKPVLEAIEKVTGTDPRFCFTIDGRKEYVSMRYLVCYLLNRYTNLTLYQIALLVSGSGDTYHHSTILHGIGTIKTQLEIIGTNGNARPVSQHTTDLINDIDRYL